MTATKILAVGLVVALGATWYSNHLLNMERTAHADTRSTYAAQVANAERVAREQSEKHRATEQEMRDAQETHAAEVKALHLNLDRARNRAAVESRRVQDAAHAAAERARAQCENTSASDMGASTGDPIGVLANVLGLADERAGILADIAEQRGIAGRACEREYDRAREALMR
jgi:septal ring factor EnvC (AmiA/AmiB activator)